MSTVPAAQQVTGVQVAEALYIHTPYCVRKCPYCDFYKVARPEPGAVSRSAPSGEAFIRALAAEALQWRDACPAPRTVFIGGGTPTALTVDELAALMALLHDTFDLSAIVEWTVEANPNSLTADKARLLADAGVNRLSIGVQSLDARALAFLGRLHSAADVPRAFETAREAGITNLSLDLISALGPAANVEEPARTLADIATAMADPDIGGGDGNALVHISVYTLIVEPGTPFWQRAERGDPLVPPDDVEAATYAATTRALAAHGLQRYEISNYARPGRECRHNLAYWRCEPWLGLGPSAHSFDGRTRRANARDLARYVSALDPQSTTAGPQSAVDMTETLTPLQVLEERLLMGLRLADGIDFAAAASAAAAIADPSDADHWHALTGAAPARTADLVDAGWIEWTGPRLRLTEAGVPLADRLVLELASRLDAG